LTREVLTDPKLLPQTAQVFRWLAASNRFEESSIGPRTPARRLRTRRSSAAGEAKLAGGTMGIGVALGEEAKCYPHYILAYHQVVNDTCGGRKIACTY
jgi:hypothetical protein